MSVIVDLTIPPDSFELGRILELEGEASVVLENLIPLGEKAVPFFTVHEPARKDFEANVREHPSVESITEVSTHDDQVLYALDWTVSRDLFFQAIFEHNGNLLSGTGRNNAWSFEIRFPAHDALSEFQDSCSNARIPLEVRHVFNPTRPTSGPWYGLTNVQRDTLTRAVQEGYYSIPRQQSTKELAEEFDVSDQAVTERLRRAIVALVENTIIASLEAEQTERAEESLP